MNSRKILQTLSQASYCGTLIPHELLWLSLQYYSILDEVEVYMKYLLLERLKKKGIAGVDAQISDIDVESSLATSESRFLIRTEQWIMFFISIAPALLRPYKV